MAGATNDAWGGATVTVTVGAVDVSCDFVTLSVDRSKNRLWDPADAGVAQVSLNLGPGGQPASRGPVGASVRIHVAYLSVAVRYLFTGRVQRRRLSVDPVHGDVLVLDCVDEFEQLARVNLRAAPTDVAVGAGDSIADRLGRWLDAADSTTTRAFGLSDFTCPETLLDGNVLRQLQVTALADGGDFFVAGDGTITFLPWRWRDTADTPAAVFADRRLHEWVPYSTAQYNDDLDEVQNQVTGTRRDVDPGVGTDPVPQTATNTSSVTSYGARGDALDDLELEDDTQVATRVTSLVAVAAQPNPRFDSIVVQPAFDPARSWPRTIPVTFGSLIAANRVWADGTQAALLGHVIGERWTITPDDATVEYRVTGTGTWDADRPPRPPVALERCADGTLHVPDGFPCDTTSTVLIKDADGVVLATYPPGSLCECGTVEVPDGGVELCLDDGVTQVCTPIDDPRLDALLWFDVLEPGPDLIERIDGDPVDPGDGLGATRIDAIPGLYDAMDANLDGGLIGTENATKLGSTSLAPGWMLDFWYFGAVIPHDPFTVIDLGTVKLNLTTAYDPSAQWEAVVVDDTAVTHLSGPISTPELGAWQHWEIRYSAASGSLTVRADGTLEHADAFPGAPADPNGDWAVSLPGEASIGEVIVYGDRPILGHYDETIIADSPFAYWPLDSEHAGGGPADYDSTVIDDSPFAYWPLDTEV